MNLEPFLSPDDQAAAWRSARRMGQARRRAMISPDEVLRRREERENRARRYYPDLPIHEALDRLADDDAARAS